MLKRRTRIRRRKSYTNKSRKIRRYDKSRRVSFYSRDTDFRRFRTGGRVFRETIRTKKSKTRVSPAVRHSPLIKKVDCLQKKNYKKLMLKKLAAQIPGMGMLQKWRRERAKNRKFIKDC